MSYYENNGQWSAPNQNNWDHQANPVRTGASGPQAQDDYAFSNQFDEVDRAYENLARSGKLYAMNGRGGGRMGPVMGTQRPHTVTNYEDNRAHQPGLQSFYANQRHNPSRGPNDAEQAMQAKRRMAAQRERELRNLHTEQQFQRTVLSEATFTGKPMSEDETRQLIARQRSALYGEGPFADQAGYVDETGAVRPGAPGPSGPSSARGHSPLSYDITRANVPAEIDTTTSTGSSSVATAEAPSLQQQPSSQPAAVQAASPAGEVGSRNAGNVSPRQPVSGSTAAKSGPSAQLSRTNTTSPVKMSAKSAPKLDMAVATKVVPNPSVTPIGTRPSGSNPATGNTTASSKVSTTPLASPGNWARGNSLWGQSSGLGAQARVWG